MYAYLLPFQHDMDIILLPYKKTSKKVKKHITINGENIKKSQKCIIMEKYVIDDYQYRALLAMREFAENAFCGYQKGHGQKEEQELANSFTWLVINFIDLVDATKEPIDEYIEKRQEIQSLRKQ